MKTYPNSSPQNVQRYIWLNVGLPIVVLFLVSLISFIALGLYDNYQKKCNDVQNFAKILAHNASLNQFDLVADQVNEVMQQDTVVKNINFYATKSTNEFDSSLLNKQSSEWVNAWFSDTVNVYEGVTVQSSEDTANQNQPQSSQQVNQSPPLNIDLTKNTDRSIESAATLSDIAQNTALVGYISIDIDLQKLRRQWFFDNLILLVLVGSLMLSIMFFVLWKLYRPLSLLKSMATQAQALIKNDSLDIRSFQFANDSASQVFFSELDVLTDLIKTLLKRHRNLELRYEALKQEGNIHRTQKQLASQNTRFQSLIMHELKDSLNDITNGINLIDSHYISNEQAEAIVAISQGTNKLETTLNQIAQLNRIEQGLVSVSITKLHPVQLIEKLVQSYKLKAQEKQLQLIMKVRHVDHVLAGDVAKIESILNELISNAITYTPSGSITIDSTMAYFKKNVRWNIKIIDTGIGIDEQYFTDVFVPFFQINPQVRTHLGSDDQSKPIDIKGDTQHSSLSVNKHPLETQNALQHIDNAKNPQQTRPTQSANNPKGTGIGLGIAQKLTYLLGGELTVESNPPEQGGSTFMLSLMLQDWQHYELFTQLKGVQIALFEQKLLSGSEHQDEQELTDLKALESYGATIEPFSDSYILTKHLTSQRYHVVLISASTSIKEVSKLCHLLREQEVNYRVLIVWHKYNVDTPSLESLESIGLDYLLNPKQPLDEQVKTLRQWVFA